MSPSWLQTIALPSRLLALAVLLIASGCGKQPAGREQFLGSWSLDLTQTQAVAHERYRRAQADPNYRCSCNLSLDEELGALLNILKTNEGGSVRLTIAGDGSVKLGRGGGSAGGPGESLVASGVLAQTGEGWTVTWQPVREGEGPCTLLLHDHRLELRGIAARGSQFGLIFVRQPPS
ncbi:MAG: hypothetical protein ACKN9R_00820 [Candidatus Limnocylindrus sp.]